VALTRLTLTDFRSYAHAQLEPGPGFVVLTGENGAGKTNILEAISLLTPGRGLRGASLGEMARLAGPGGFSVSASMGEVVIGTGTLPAAPERRVLRVNGAAASVNSLSEWLSVLWLTPAMDRLFAGTAGDRRRFLDRLVLALEPSHAHHAARYEAAMRARNKLLAEPDGADPDWLTALEAGMAEHGAAVSEARHRTVAALGEAPASTSDDAFATAVIALDGWADRDLARDLRDNRGRDAAAGRATAGPHRQDLSVSHAAKNMPASRCSTGEQKALLLGIVLAHAELVAGRRRTPLILLLDEVAAHLDARRREALFARLQGRGQVWMTGTEAVLFDVLGKTTHFHVSDGVPTPL
jgi:DNA replication and repair protein RecF